MKAIILAAGQSSRLYPLTKETPKCLLELEKGTSIIDVQISMIKHLGIDDIVVVTGFESEKIKEKLKNSVRYLHYKDYEKTNNLFTLNSISEELNSDLLILFSDIVISFELLKKCVNSNDDFNLLIDIFDVSDKTMRVTIKNNSIIDLGSHISVDEGHANFIGIAKYSKLGALKLKNIINEICKNSKFIDDYYTRGLVELAKKHKINYTENKNQYYWNEIDYLKDYNILRNKFSSIKNKLFK